MLLSGTLDQGPVAGTRRRGHGRAAERERSSQDPHLHYRYGGLLFGADDLPDLPDNPRPNAAGHRRMGEQFADPVFGQDGPFAAFDVARDAAAA